jgi:hypothetical protein
MAVSAAADKLSPRTDEANFQALIASGITVYYQIVILR